ncbi:MAG TPA: DUF1302 family protein [Chitinolyticbacter sp.]|nr:DUF1302 family protein [Chitinolyticbacter sp.]
MRHVRALLVGLLAVAAPAWALDGWMSGIYTTGLDGGPDYERGLAGQLRHSAEWQGWRVKFDGRYRWNAAACEPEYGTETCNAYRSTFDWREFYLARDIGDWSVSAGVQQVVWGRADNLRVFDLVNPLDLRDYVLPDLNDYRIATPMLRANGNLGEWTLEAVYLPYFKPNRYAATGSVYDLGIDAQFAAAGLPILREERPERDFANGEWGAVLSTTRGDVDWSFLAFSTWNDDPIYRYDFSDPAAPGMVAEYRRQSVFGVSNAIALDGGWVARSELTWSPDAPYSRAQDDDGTVRSSTVAWLLGLDYSWRDWLITGQVSDRWIADWQPDYLTPEHQAFFTLSATGTQLSGRLATRVAYTWMPQHGDGSWLQWRSSYKFTDDWQLEGTLDLLNGKSGGYFGQFRDKDRLRLELRRYF